jgi:hypothetical protein
LPENYRLQPLAGAPNFGPTFLCDSSQCYRLYTATKNFDGARKQCATDGGELVTYTSLSQQLLVENYFKAFTLPAGYWTGVSRATTTGAQWQYVDGSPLPQNASNDPYAHFTWIQASQVSLPLHGLEPGSEYVPFCPSALSPNCASVARPCPHYHKQAQSPSPSR